MRQPQGITLFLAGLVLAGCINPGTTEADPYAEYLDIRMVDSGVTPENRTIDQYYFVIVRGHEAEEILEGDGEAAISHEDCPARFQYDPAAETVRYDSSLFSIDRSKVKILLGLQYQPVRVESSGVVHACTKQVLFPYAERAVNAFTLRPGLDVSLTVETLNGFLSYNATYFVPMGKKIEMSFNRVERSDTHTFNVTGQVEVLNLGAWPRSGLTAGF